jgi:hypothetical protein
MTGSRGAIIDAWMQHPSSGFVDSPMSKPLRRWSRDQLAKGEVPVEWTLEQMDEECLRGLDRLALDDETRELFLHANAERVFKLPRQPEDGGAASQR